jgi:ABC-type transporter Mla maintaining outer membrane lipid asymmetry ATPase subunit MlaF
MNPPRDSNRRAVIELIEVDIPSEREPASLVLCGVNWTISEGEFWVIGGLQGTGKSELLCTAATLLQPARGTCKLFGREAAPAYGEGWLAERLRVGLVFGAGGRLLNHLTVRQNVALPLEYHHSLDPARAEARVQALLDVTETALVADQAPSSLNPGWRQRVALARALALRPEVLLLDNPLAGLDSCHTRWWVELLDQLWAGHPVMEGRPMTLVVAGNDLRPWLDPAHRFALLEGTRFVNLGTAPDLDADQASPVLRDLLAAPPQPA